MNDRKQFVEVDGFKSYYGRVKSGVPQGTVLGPVLFMIYINDLIDTVKESKIIVYADDAKIYSILEPGSLISDSLQLDLLGIHEWSKIWQLSVATHKCYIFIFGKFVNAPVYKLGNEVLEVNNEIKDLGFLITSNGKSSLHCKTIVIKSLKIVANIFRVFKSREGC